MPWRLALRWELLESTSPSGRMLFRCRVCHRTSYGPDKDCKTFENPSGGCKEAWARAVGPLRRTIDWVAFYLGLDCEPWSPRVLLVRNLWGGLIYDFQKWHRRRRRRDSP